MEIKRIKRGTIAEEITEQIRQLIASGALKPGERLPSERELAERFGVGRPSVREAMHSLSFIGVLEIRPGDGTYLLDPRPLLTDQFKQENAINRYTSFELVEVRQAIEVESAGLAAVRATDEDKERIMENCHKLKDNRAEGYIEADLLFHNAIVEATQNRFLSEILTTARGLEKQPLYYSLQDHKYMLESSRMHIHIAEAIVAGEVELARLSMSWHFELMKKALKKGAQQDGQ